MAIMLQKLCEKANYLYGMRVLAGETGMASPVQWVHVVEDIEAGNFLHGNELVFTTGIAQTGTDWLVPFAETLISKDVSGLVLNIGPYISEAPRNLIEFCNAHGFPLLDVPWKTRLVDITRDFCNQIIRNQKVEEDVGTTFKNLAYYPAEKEKYYAVLARNNFDVNAEYRILAASVTEIPERPGVLFRIREHLSRDIFALRKQAAYFEGKDTVFCVLENFTREQAEGLAAKLQKRLENAAVEKKVFLALGGAGSLSVFGLNYRRVQAMLRMAEKGGESPLCFDQLGMKKILLSVDDATVLQEYYNDMLERLENYDRDNGTTCMELLKRYLDCDGSVQKVAEESFVHRNTVNYQLNKIKRILNMDLVSMEERFCLMLAFRIREVL